MLSSYCSVHQIETVSRQKIYRTRNQFGSQRALKKQTTQSQSDFTGNNISLSVYIEGIFVTFPLISLVILLYKFKHNSLISFYKTDFTKF